MLRDREKDAAYRKSYYSTHKAEAAALNKAWREKNHERNIARVRAWDAANAERRRVTSALHYAATKSEHQAYHKKWREKNRDKRVATQAKRRARVLGALGSFTSEEFAMIVKRQRGRCADCKKKRKLVADHIIPISRGGSNLILNIQGLCQSCNSRKGASVPKGSQFGLFDRIEAVTAHNQISKVKIEVPAA